MKIELVDWMVILDYILSVELKASIFQSVMENTYDSWF